MSFEGLFTYTVRVTLHTCLYFNEVNNSAENNTFCLGTTIPCKLNCLYPFIEGKIYAKLDQFYFKTKIV